MTVRIQRVENAAVALAVAVVFVTSGYPWWTLLAMFLIFDLSAVGYLSNGRLGPLLYNAVHNYAGPAVLTAAYALGVVWGLNVWAIGLLAGCWAFHVAVDRTLGYGLKTERGFRHTHLGVIGRSRRDPSE
ncbi:DUF4260 domain-containing protein [Microbacterium lacticum]